MAVTKAELISTRKNEACLAAMKRLLKQIFKKADSMEMTFSELARAANLNSTTVSKLYYEKTEFPLFRTVWKLAESMGFEIELRAVQAVRTTKKRPLKKAS